MLHPHWVARSFGQRSDGGVGTVSHAFAVNNRVGYIEFTCLQHNTALWLEATAQLPQPDQKRATYALSLSLSLSLSMRCI